MLQTLIDLLITSFFAIIMILIIESFGFFALKITSKIFKEKFKNDWIINFFVGLLFYGISLFVIGNLRILYKEVVLAFSILVPLFVCLYYKRWQDIKLKIDLLKLKTNWAFALGLIVTSGILFISAFRPLTEFDALWYHLPIPKYFLQVHNIDYTGAFWRYSVHPYLNFFWNLLPLSLPLGSVLNGIILNIFQWICTVLAIIYTSNYLNQKLKTNWYLQFLIPIFLGINSITVYFLGTSYNDLFALSLGMVFFTFVDQKLTTKIFTRYELVIAFYILILLFLLKIFFGIFAAIALFFLVFWYFGSNSEKLDSKEKIIKELRFVIISTLSLGAIFVLPWIIRSYIFTGRLLDPIGLPGLTEDTYNFAGSGDAKNHWTSFIWKRLYEQFPSIFITQVSPIFGIGLLAVLNKKIRENFLSWWSLAISSFFAVYFISITADTRYRSPSIALFLILGAITIIYLTNEGVKLIKLPNKIAFLGLIVAISMLTYINFISSGDLYRRLYFNRTTFKQNLTLEQKLAKDVQGGVYYYYANEDTKVPADLKKEDTVFPYNIQLVGYIDNPIFGRDEVDLEKIRNKNNLDEFLDSLISKNVKYIIIKNNVNKDSICKDFLIKDQDSCKNNNRLKLVENDDKNIVAWYKID